MLTKPLSKKRIFYEWILKVLMLLSVGITAALVLYLIIYVFSKGILTITWELLSTSPSYLADRIGILPGSLNTLYIVL